MKNLYRSLRILLAFVVLSIAGHAGAQTVSIGTIPGSHFCTGDPISVDFTVTGLWGHHNAFTLQLSDTSGSFSNGFQNLASLVDTLPGTFTINAKIPYALPTCTHYRFRILAAIPYVPSADNGSDISIGTGAAGFSWEIVPSVGATGTPVIFAATSSVYPVNPADTQDSAFWDFGPEAIPQKVTATGLSYNGLGFTQDVTYLTSGDKTVTLGIARPGGCGGDTITTSVHIYDCTIPSIPHDAIVINADTTGWQSGTYWVNPGFKFRSYGSDTVFAESGSTILGATVSYMKPGSSLTSGGIAIYADGANVSGAGFSLKCPNLNFDYTNAPPNAAFPMSVAKNDINTVTISLSPNPTNGLLRITGLPSQLVTVSAFNILGEMVLAQEYSSSKNCTLDLSGLRSGTYYIRFATANSVITKKVVKN